MGQDRPTCKGDKMTTQAKANAVVHIIDRDNMPSKPRNKCPLMTQSGHSGDDAFPQRDLGGVIAQPPRGMS